MKDNSYELIRRIYRRKTIDKYQTKAVYLGYTSLSKIYQFLLIRLLFCFIIFSFIFVCSDWNLILAPIITIVLYYGLDYLAFDYPIKKKELRLEKEAMYFFEVFSLSIDAGKNIVQALKVTTNNMDGELSQEFKKMLKEVQYGKSFHDAFSDLRNRICSDVIQNIILNIMQIYESGGNISQTLNQQIEFIHNKRLMNIKAAINKIPIKISVVSVLIFIPLILLLVLSPVILEYIASI